MLLGVPDQLDSHSRIFGLSVDLVYYVGKQFLNSLRACL